MFEISAETKILSIITLNNQQKMPSQNKGNWFKLKNIFKISI